MFGFDPRPHAGSDSQARHAIDVSDPFRSTPPRGERPAPTKPPSAPFMFRSTPPRGERPSDVFATWAHAVFRSTPPRGERLNGLADGAGLQPVSIHVPTRGATRSAPSPPAAPARFDPRPHAGSDVLDAHLAADILVFRSTPPRGERPDQFLYVSLSVTVSIHAPTRGATPWPLGPLVGHACFDPRPHAGSDVAPSIAVLIWVSFRSTPPRGERP